MGLGTHRLGKVRWSKSIRHIDIYAWSETISKDSEWKCESLRDTLDGGIYLFSANLAPRDLGIKHFEGSLLKQTSHTYCGNLPKRYTITYCINSRSCKNKQS